MRVKIAAGLLFVLFAPIVDAQTGHPYDLMETSIDQIHHEIVEGTLTCHSLVEQYLARIRAYDKQGPTINSMIYVNSSSLAEADAFDLEFRRSHRVKPLACIPIVLKDNFDTADMPTTAGSLAMKGAQPDKDAFAVVKLREAGAIILGKANMQEFASGGISVSSLGGQVKNPYDLTRTPGGSSGGTGAAVAANFGSCRYRFRYRRFHSLSCFGQQSRGNPANQRTDQPRWHRTSLLHAGHHRTHHENCGGYGADPGRYGRV